MQFCIVLVSLLVLCNADKRLLLNDPGVNADRINRLELLVNQLNASLTSLQLENLQQMEQNLQQKEQIKALQSAVSHLNETKPVFYAVLVQHPLKISNAANLKFEGVKVNNGNGYDPMTGVFIAPINGIYHFTSVVYNEGTSNAIIQLNKNNDLVVNGFSSGTAHAISHSMNTILRLVKGDHVYVQHRGVSSDVILGAQHSSFSGFYISE